MLPVRLHQRGEDLETTYKACGRVLVASVPVECDCNQQGTHGDFDQVLEESDHRNPFRPDRAMIEGAIPPRLHTSVEMCKNGEQLLLTRAVAVEAIAHAL